jgi:endonuclease/exonuclease/phosphatase (EEP) superfamily protein YafD
VRLVALTPFATVLYAAAFLLLLVAWARGLGAWRSMAKVLTVFTVVGLLAHAAWASGPFLGSPTAAAAGDQEPITVMSSNLRFGEGDTARVVELVLANDVDVLVLQEVTPQALAGLQSAGLEDVLPDSAGAAEPGTDGTMVFSTMKLARVKRLDTGFGSWQMVLRTADGPVRLLAVHPRPPMGDARQWRADHLVLRAAAREIDGPALVVGDFNATMDHAPMRELVGRGYDDAATEANAQWQPTWPAAGEVSRLGIAVPSLLPIDHVLARGGLRAVRTETVTVPETDHRALLAVLDW